MSRGKLLLPVVFLITFLFVVSSKSVFAFSFGDIVNGVKDIFNGNADENIKSRDFTIQSTITLAPYGDVNNDNQIDAGDIVRFTYTITNTTDNAYAFATLKTNINRKQLNFIHNITGTASLDDDGKTITIPNFRIGANQTATIAFDARVNYYTNEDPTIATEAEFLSNDKKSIAKSLKKEIKAKRINKDKIPGMIRLQIEKDSNQ